MKDQVYGVERGHGKKMVSWVNEQAKSTNLKLKVQLDENLLTTQNFGSFELFSVSDDSIASRKLLYKAGKRFDLKIIEGGYNEKARIIRRKKSDYAKVIKGEKILGHLELETSRFGTKKWEIKSEERR